MNSPTRSSVAWALGWMMVAFMSAWGIKIFGFELFRVSSSSMEPTLLVGDYVLVAKYPYGYTKYSFPWEMSWSGIWAKRPVTRGDIVIFHQPKALSNPWIKRVVGLPEEKIVLTQKGLDLAGTLCPLIPHPFTSFCEEILPGNVRYHVRCPHPLQEKVDNPAPFVVPRDGYYVLGDARDASQDSRDPSISAVSHAQLLGKAVFVLFSQAPKGHTFHGWFERVRWERFLKPLS